jgi:hypothetical protein
MGLSSVPVLLLLLIITVIINIIWATSARQLTGILIIIVISATIVIIVIIIFKSQTRGNFSASWRRATLQGFIFPKLRRPAPPRVISRQVFPHKFLPSRKHHRVNPTSDTSALRKRTLTCVPPEARNSWISGASLRHLRRPLVRALRTLPLPTTTTTKCRRIRSTSGAALITESRAPVFRFPGIALRVTGTRSRRWGRCFA